MTVTRAVAVDAPGLRAGWGRAAWLLAFGGLGLASGALVYLTDRSGTGALFGAVGGWWPSFVHPWAFSLFSAAALPARRPAGLGACVAWAGIDVAFEIGQHPLLSPSLAALLLGVFGPTPPARWLAGYFVHGTFDPADVVAALLGGALAAIVIHRLDHRET